MYHFTTLVNQLDRLIWYLYYLNDYKLMEFGYLLHTQRVNTKWLYTTMVLHHFDTNSLRAQFYV